MPLDSLQYADNKSLTGLITNNDETAYHEEIGKLSTWCSANYLELKKKTKEIIVDFTKKKQTPPSLMLQNENVEHDM